MQKLTRIHLISHLKVSNNRAEEAKDFLKNEGSGVIHIVSDTLSANLNTDSIYEFLHGMRLKSYSFEGSNPNLKLPGQSNILLGVW